MQATGLGNYCLEVHSTKDEKSSVLEQLSTAWRERNLVTEEHWSMATGDLRILQRRVGQVADRTQRVIRWNALLHRQVALYAFRPLICPAHRIPQPNAHARNHTPTNSQNNLSSSLLGLFRSSMNCFAIFRSLSPSVLVVLRLGPQAASIRSSSVLEGQGA
ncbi:hypothetical protein ACVWWO_003467 [Bradyrhizobium sp. F1.13.1]